MKSVSITILASLALAFPGMAQVRPQPTMGQRNAETLTIISFDKARKADKIIASCIYNLHKPKVKKLLANSDPVRIDYPSAGLRESTVAQHFSLTHCARKAVLANQGPVRTALHPIRLRPILAEQAYLDAHNEPLAIRANEPEALPNRFFVKAENQGPARSNAALADCIVYNAPVQADVLTRTVPTSTEERSATDALAGIFSRCSKQGDEVAVNVATVRTLVAEGLWSRSHYGSEASRQQDQGGVR